MTVQIGEHAYRLRPADPCEHAHQTRYSRLAGLADQLRGAADADEAFEVAWDVLDTVLDRRDALALVRRVHDRPGRGDQRDIIAAALDVTDQPDQPIHRPSI